MSARETTMPRLLPRRVQGSNDDGVALIVVLLVMVVLTTLGFAMTGVAVGNLGNAGRDRVAGKALASAEGGVAQAIAHLRTNGVNGLATSDWGTTGHPVTVSSGVTYLVTITPLQALDISAGVRVGEYLIRSVGTAGSGPGKQIVEQTVKVKPFDFPMGIFTEQNLTLSGQVPIYTASVFTRGCINDRDKLTFDGYDPAYKDALGQPLRAAAHAVGYITTSSSCSANPTSDNGRIHPDAYPRYCSHRYPQNTDTYPYDQDGLGGQLGSSSDPYCINLSDQYHDFTDPNNPSTSSVEKTSKFTYDKLEKIYGYRSRGLSDAEYEVLKNKAKADGTYFTGSGTTLQASSLPLPCYNTTATPCASNGPKLKSAVVYLKLPANTKVKFQNSDLAGYTYPTIDNPCGDFPTVIVVVEGGNLEFAGNPGITGSVFVPDGNFDFQAGQIVGTVFAKTLQLTGNSLIRLTPCALKNIAGGLLTVTPERFSQDDGDV